MVRVDSLYSCEFTSISLSGLRNYFLLRMIGNCKHVFCTCVHICYFHELDFHIFVKCLRTSMAFDDDLQNTWFHCRHHSLCIEAVYVPSQCKVQYQGMHMSSEHHAFVVYLGMWSTSSCSTMIHQDAEFTLGETLMIINFTYIYIYMFHLYIHRYMFHAAEFLKFTYICFKHNTQYSSGCGSTSRWSIPRVAKQCFQSELVQWSNVVVRWSCLRHVVFCLLCFVHSHSHCITW